MGKYDKYIQRVLPNGTVVQNGQKVGNVKQSSGKGGVYGTVSTTGGVGSSIKKNLTTTPTGTTVKGSSGGSIANATSAVQPKPATVTGKTVNDLDLNKMVAEAAATAPAQKPAAQPAAPVVQRNPYEVMIENLTRQIAANSKSQADAANARKADYLDTVEAQYDKWVAGQEELRDAYLQRAAERQARDEAMTRANYDNTARQNYINYMQAQKQLPEQLRALGINGGASESSLIRLGANYGTNVANNEMARAQALDNVAQQYAEIIADYETQYRQAILARDDAKATQIAQYLDSWNKELSDIESSKNEAILNAYATGTENSIAYNERRAAEKREDKIRNEGYAREDRLRKEDNEREDTIRKESYAREDKQRKEDRADAKEQTKYERNRYKEEYKDAQQAKKLEQYAAGLARYQSVDTLKKMADNIKKDKNWAKDPFKYGKVQAINARIGEIRQAKNK